MIKTPEFSVEMPVRTEADRGCQALCRALAGALALSLLFGAASYLKYRQAARQLAVYQKGALSLIGLKLDETEKEDKDPAGFAFLSSIGSPAHPPARHLRQPALPAAAHRRGH